MRFWISVCLATCVGALATAEVSAATIVVPPGGDLQAAINAAQPGDVITLAPNATYTGNFVLPNKGAIADYITIRSAAPDALLPPAGVRITPAYSAQLPKLRSGNNMAALVTATAANHWRLMFLEFLANKDGYGDVITLGAGDSTQTQLAQVPYALILDRIYVHGDPVVGQKRGIALHTRDTSILNSWVSECKAIAQDSQAISGFNGPGNYLIENNYLEGAAENFLLGGADPTIPGLVITNVTFRRNYLRKPLAWRDPIVATPANVTATAAPGAGSLPAGTYYYKVQARAASGQTNTAASTASAQVSATIAAGTAGGVTIAWTPVVGAAEYRVYGRASNGQNIYWKTTTPFLTDNGSAGTSGTPASATKWSVKNVFELKSAQDVLVEGNVFEGMWMADQPGYPIVFTPRNQGGRAPWTIVQRVTFQHNIVRHTAGGVNILGTDNVSPSQRTNHITVRHNIFDDLTSASWGSGSRPFQIGDGADSITIDHNTVMSTQPTVFWLYGAPSTSVVYTNNMSTHSTYGIFGSGQSSGNLSISTYLPGGVVRANVLAGGSASKYPAGNFFPSLAAWPGNFVNYAAGDYHLSATSLYRHAGTDGEDLGANVDVVLAQTANALTGDNSMPPGTTRVQILPTSLADGVVGAPYTAALSCTGATGACGWRIQSSSLPGGVAVDTVAGLVYGTPTAVETGLVTLEAYDTAYPANSAVATLQLTIVAPPFEMTMPTAPAGRVGVAYQLSPGVSGTLGTATWTVLAGTLPGGLVLDGFSGAITGVPSTWGTTTALIQVADSWGANRRDTETLTLTIAPQPLAIAPIVLANASYHTAYYASLAVSGGTGTVVWSAGALPAGLALDANGAIGGTPASIGTFTFDVTAQDASWPDNHATGTLSLTIDPPGFTASIAAASSGRVGLPFQIAATSEGQVGTTLWSLASGTLPPGVTIDGATGVISGVPTASGVFSFVVQAQDSWNSSRVALVPATVSIAPLQLMVATTSLPAGRVRRAYSATLASLGGTGLTTWTVVNGSLPNGLTLAATGVISGTPLSVGSSTLTVQAADAGWAGNVATQTLTLDVSAREIVLYASDVSRTSGTWTLVSDAAAAGGSRIWNQDRAAAKLVTPLANPVNFFEITFEAEAGVGYHLWMRGKADGNAWANDSVYVQYSGSVAANGAATARIGSTSARTLSIEQGTNAGVQGWGWSDDEWDGLGAPIYFAVTGPQTIRVQVREDGLSLDQIVLSSVTYASVAPGAPKNDTTIVPR